MDFLDRGTNAFALLTGKLLALVFWERKLDQQSGNFPISIRKLLAPLILGIDTDNGKELINEAMVAYCERERLTFTRGRPGVKNDQCFVEQKNGAVVRSFIGHDRLSGEQAYRQLLELYRALRLYSNCFQSSMKLQTVVAFLRMLTRKISGKLLVI